MVLLFLDQQLNDSCEYSGTVPSRIVFSGAKKMFAVGLLSKLKDSNGTANEPPFEARQIIGPGLRQGTSVFRVIPEMIEPDLKIGLHERATSHERTGETMRADSARQVMQLWRFRAIGGLLP